MNDFNRIREALQFIPASDRDTWVKMGMAIKSDLGDTGFDLWSEWSQQDESYNDQDARAVWKSIQANGKVTARTLFHEAQQHGFTLDSNSKPIPPTPEAIAERERKVLEAEAEREQARSEAATKAVAIWKAATHAPDDHPYLVRKRIKANGAHLYNGALVIPIRADGNLHSLQFIEANGDKKFLTGGRVAGCYFSIGATKDAAALCICEGFATGATIHEATGYPVAVAFNAGNLLAVTKAMRERFPALPLILCADDDYRTEGNPGLTKATEAARSLGGLLAIPDFGAPRPDSATDFNDLHQAQSLEAVKHAIAGVLDSGNAMTPPEQTNTTGDAVDWLKANPAATLADIAALPAVEALQAAQASTIEEEHQSREKNAPEPLPDLPAVLPFDDDYLPDELRATPEHDAALIKHEVSEVSGVQANNGGLSADTSADIAGVSEVSNEPIIPGESGRPCFKVFDDWQPLPGGKLKPGVWFFSIKHSKGEAPPALIQQWICSPLHVEAVTFDGQDNNFGRMLRFKTTIGKWREWAMPMELLRGAGDELRGELLAMGVEIDPQAGRTLLGQYLQAKPPVRRIHCVLQVGWCGDSFVLPDTVIGAASSGVIFQSGERGHDEFTRAGTLAGWQSEISARAVGNPLLVLALSASFAGPMLARCNGESGGVHFVGDSCTGKTTAIEAACSTWGGANYRRSWRATNNGMEGAASLFNDGLLALDEIGECDPKEVGAIIYALGNGRGKQRASRTGNARGVTRWRCFVLSSGERTIATAMMEGGHKAKAGQSVRLLDIPAARSFGAWDNLHGLPSGAAFSDAITRAAATHHGHAGRAFLEKLTRDERNFSEYLERFKSLPGLSADDGEGQAKRAAGRFAMLALAGETATEYGITGWPEGAAIEAAAVGFKAWQSTRGHGNDERRQILEQVAGFIERHGDGRFSDADNNSETLIRDRAGWWRDDGGERTYLFNAEAMREAVKGFDYKRALDILQESGALPAPGTDGKRAKFYRIGKRGVKLYPIQTDKLGGDHGA